MQIQSPYKGLAPYDVADKDNFFGREREKQIVLGKIFANNITLLFAGTGVGKSSLLRAAIFPALTAEQALDVAYYADWVSEPLEGLKATIQQMLRANGKITGRELKMSDELLPFLTTCTAYASEPLILMLDQFEELFQYHARSGRLHPFVEQMAQVVNAPDLPVSLVFAMREDFLAELNIFKGRIPGLFDNYYRLEQLHIEQARTAIEKPVAKFGFRYEEGLVDQLLHDLAAREQEHQPGTTTPAAPGQEAACVVEPPYLQIVCHELWRAEKDNPQKVITMARYITLGRTKEIVRRHFEQAMAHFSPREQTLSSAIFRYLVTARGTKMAYRREDLADLINDQLKGVSVNEIQLILEYLAGRNIRILRSDQRPDGTWYELYHDVFAQIIRDWQVQVEEKRQMKEAEQERKAAEQERRIRRNRAAFQIALGIGLAIALILSALAFWQRNLAIEERQRAEDQAIIAQRNELEARKQQEIAEQAQAEAMQERDKAQQAEKEAKRQSRLSLTQVLSFQAIAQQGSYQDTLVALLARQAYRFNEQNEGGLIAQVDGALRTVLSLPYFNHILQGHTSGVNAAVFSPDNLFVASGSDDKTVRVWTLQHIDNDTLVLSGHSGRVKTVAFSPDGQILASGSEDKTIRLWYFHQPKSVPITLRGHEGDVNSVVFSPDGRWLASGSSDKTIRLWDVNNFDAKPRVLPQKHTDKINALQFSPDGKILASGSVDRRILLWDFNNLSAEPEVLSEHQKGINALAFSPDGKVLASGSSDQTIRLWNLDDLTNPLILKYHAGGVYALAFSSDGERLASGSLDHRVCLWDWHIPGKEPIVLRGHQDTVYSVSFSSEGNRLVSASLDRTLRVWELQPPEAAPVILHGHTHTPTSIAVSPDGKLLASGSLDRTVRLWDLALRNPENLSVLRDHHEGVNAVAFSPDGNIVASGSSDRTVRLWDISQPDVKPMILSDHTKAVNAVAFSPDGALLASGSSDQTVRLWNRWNLTSPSRVLEKHKDAVSAIAFSPDGKRLASGSYDKTICLWNLQTDPITCSVLGSHVSIVRSVAFSPDGKMLVSGGDDAAVKFWDLETMATKLTLPNKESRVFSVAFSPDGKTLAVGRRDLTIQLWDVQHLTQNPRILRGHEDWVRSVVFSPNGETLISGSSDQTLMLWIVRPETLAAIVCQKVWRNFTQEEWRQFVGRDMAYEPTCPNLPVPPESNESEQN